MQAKLARAVSIATLLAVGSWSIACSHGQRDGGIGPERSADLRACVAGDTDFGKCREVSQYAKEHGTKALRSAVSDLLDCVNSTLAEPLLSSPACRGEQARVVAAL
jgi:hypothetical protein